MPLGVVSNVAAHVTKMLVGTASSSLHIVDLVAEVEVFLTLGGQLVAIVLVPGQSVLLVLLLVFVHLFADVGKDCGCMEDELPVLLLVVLGLLEGAAKLGVLLLEVLGILCRRVKLVRLFNRRGRVD